MYRPESDGLIHLMSEALAHPGDRSPGRTDEVGSLRPVLVPAVHRAADVLRFIGCSPGPRSLAEITAAVKAPKSSVLGVCQALTAEQLLARGQDGRYWLGTAVADLGSVAAAASPYVQRFAVTVPSETNTFYVAEMRAADRESAERGVPLIMESAGNDTVLQARQIEHFVAEAVDLIIVDPVASHGLEQALELAREANIPTVAINANAIGADLAITTDNVLAGALAARYLGRNLRPGSRMAVVDGMPVTAIADRVEGFRNALRDYPGVSVVSYGRGSNDRPSGKRVAAELLAADPTIDAFFAVNDPIARGVSDACVEFGVTPAIASVDGSAEVVGQIVAGQLHVSTSTQDPAGLVAAAFRFGMALLAGYQPTQGTVLLPSATVSIENAKDYRPW